MLPSSGLSPMPEANSHKIAQPVNTADLHLSLGELGKPPHIFIHFPKSAQLQKKKIIKG